MVCAGITYSDNVIYVEYNAADGSKGASFNDAFTFQDIYDTDIANGWGFIEKTNYNSFTINYIGFHFISGCIKDEGFYLYFKNSIVNYIIKTDYDANIEFISTVKASSMIVDSRVNLQVRNAEINNMILQGFYITYLCGPGTYSNIFHYDIAYPSVYTGAHYKNFYSINCVYGVRFVSQPTSIENVYIENCAYAVFAIVPTILSNLNIDSVTNTDIRIRGAENIFIDSKINLQSYQTDTVGGDKISYNKSLFTFFIKNGTNAIIKLFDKNDNIIYNTLLTTESTSDLITFQKLIINMLDGVLISDEYIDYQPLKMEVEKAGYQTLTVPDIYVTEGEPTIIRASLVPNPSPISFSISRLLSRIFASGKSITSQEVIQEGTIEHSTSLIEQAEIINNAKATFRPESSDIIIEQETAPGIFEEAEIIEEGAELVRGSQSVIDDPKPVYINEELQAQIYEEDKINAEIFEEEIINATIEIQ